MLVTWLRGTNRLFYWNLDIKHIHPASQPLAKKLKRLFSKEDYDEEKVCQPITEALAEMSDYEGIKIGPHNVMLNGDFFMVTDLAVDVRKISKKATSV